VNDVLMFAAGISVGLVVSEVVWLRRVRGWEADLVEYRRFRRAQDAANVAAKVRLLAEVDGILAKLNREGK